MHLLWQSYGLEKMVKRVLMFFLSTRASTVYEQTVILYLVILSNRLATMLFIASKGFSAPLRPPCPEVTALFLLIFKPGFVPWDITLILFTMSTNDWKGRNEGKEEITFSLTVFIYVRCTDICRERGKAFLNPQTWFSTSRTQSACSVSLFMARTLLYGEVITSSSPDG